MYVYTLWLFNIAMERSTIFKFGKPSISMDHGFHGYVSHNQRVCMCIYIIGTWSNRDELSWPAQTHAQRLSVLHIFQQFQCLLDHLSTRFVFAKWKGLFFSFRNSWTGQRKKHPLCHPIYVFFFSVIHQLCFFQWYINIYQCFLFNRHITG